MAQAPAMVCEDGTVGWLPSDDLSGQAAQVAWCECPRVIRESHTEMVQASGMVPEDRLRGLCRAAQSPQQQTLYVVGAPGEVQNVGHIERENALMPICLGDPVTLVVMLPAQGG